MILYQYLSTTKHDEARCMCIFLRVFHDDVIKWKHFPRYWPFVRDIHRSSVNFPHKGQGRRALMFSLICAWIIGWVNNREAGGLRRHRTHYDVIVMWHMVPVGCNVLIDCITCNLLNIFRRSWIEIYFYSIRMIEGRIYLRPLNRCVVKSFIWYNIVHPGVVL